VENAFLFLGSGKLAIFVNGSPIRAGSRGGCSLAVGQVSTQMLSMNTGVWAGCRIAVSFLNSLLGSWIPV